MWVSKACQFFLVPSRSSNTPLYPSKCCELGSGSEFQLFPHCRILGPSSGSTRNLGARHITSSKEPLQKSCKIHLARWLVANCWDSPYLWLWITWWSIFYSPCKENCHPWLLFQSSKSGLCQLELRRRCKIRHHTIRSWSLALGHGVCCCSKFFQKKKCNQPFVHPFEKFPKERVQNLTSQFFIPTMILLGFIKLIVKVATYPFHP